MENNYEFVEIIEARIIDLQNKLKTVDISKTEIIKEMIKKNQIILLHLQDGEEEYQLEN